MRTSDADILLIPGLGDSGEDHWQSRWEAKLPTARRVAQTDWNHPDIAAWAARIREAVSTATRPVVLVSHSFGAYAMAQAAPDIADKVRGAFVVAPPSAEALAAMGCIGLSPDLLQKPLPFKTLIVASRDDEYGTYEQAENLAKGWSAELCDAGNSGHINSASGHGPWPEGLMRFAGFLKTL